MSSAADGDRQKLVNKVTRSNYSVDTVHAFFVWCTANEIGGDEATTLATTQFEDMLLDGRDQKEAFGEAYAMLQGMCPIRRSR